MLYAFFDAVTSGYHIRNVTDAGRAFAEQARTVKPGGRKEAGLSDIRIKFFMFGTIAVLSGTRPQTPPF